MVALEEGCCERADLRLACEVRRHHRYIGALDAGGDVIRSLLAAFGVAARNDDGGATACEIARDGFSDA